MAVPQGVDPRGLRPRGAALVAHGRLRRRRLASLADDGRDVGLRDPRPHARQAARRLATSAGSPSCPTTWRSRSPPTSARSRRSRPHSRSSLRRRGPRGDGRRRPRPIEREHSLRHVAELYAAALEEAAGGGAVREVLLKDIAQAAAEIGIEAADPELGESRRGWTRLGLAVEAVAPGARERAWSLARAVPVWAWLVGLVAVSTGIRYVFTRQMVAPWIFVDELIYSELAKSFAAGGHFLVRDHSTARLRLVYPLLIAPAWARVQRRARRLRGREGNQCARHVARCRARRTSSRGGCSRQWLSLAAAALAVAIPSMVYTATLMTENAFYPIFLTSCSCSCVWLERPTSGDSSSCSARPARVPDTPAGDRARARRSCPLRSSSRAAGLPPLRPAVRIVGGAALLVVVVQLARGGPRSASSVPTTSRATSHYSAGRRDALVPLPRGRARPVARRPTFAALLVLARPARARAAAEVLRRGAVALTFWLVLEVATFASVQSFRGRGTEHVLRRAALPDRPPRLDRPRPSARRRSGDGGGVLAAALPGALPYPAS